MKKTLLLLLLGFSIVFTDCNKDEREEEDLTFEIVGEYLGVYRSNSFGEMNLYEITVEKIDKSHISVSIDPKGEAYTFVGEKQ